MELKLLISEYIEIVGGVLIVPSGIETSIIPYFIITGKTVLIVPSGIETLNRE